VGLGCAYLGGGRPDAKRLAEVQAVLDAAYEAGFRHFDTAELYGASEFRLGDFVRRAERKSLFLSTKSRVPDYLAPAEAVVHLRQNLRNSLERLGTDWLDLYLVHDVSSLETTFASGGPLEFLLEEREKGAIRGIGLGLRSHSLLEEAVRNGNFGAILTYLDYNLAHRSASALIDLAASRGVAVLNGTPLSGGLLSGRNLAETKEIHPEMALRFPAAWRVHEFAAREGVSVLSLALQWPSRNPGVTLTLTGPANPLELATTVSALQAEIPEEAWSRLEALLRDA
jgi:D-threo-aldose 1-dehydrogenase